MRGGIRVVGFHGTSGRRARSIVRYGFKRSENAYDWLGTGIYFFEENEERARAWARKRWAEDPAVIGAVVDLSGVLDLTEQGALDGLKRTAAVLASAYAGDRLELPRNRPDGRRYFDCALIDLYCAIGADDEREVTVVRGLFEEGATIHPASSIRDLTHCQLSVRDPRAILGLWRVRH